MAGNSQALIICSVCCCLLYVLMSVASLILGLVWKKKQTPTTKPPSTLTVAPSSQTCAGMQKQYGISPGSNWGTLTDPTLKAWWTAHGCNSLSTTTPTAAPSSCSELQTKYGVVPGTNWGSLSDPGLQTWWVNSGCDQAAAVTSSTTTAPASCAALKAAYGIVPGTSWGSLTDTALQGWWYKNGCDGKADGAECGASSECLIGSKCFECPSGGWKCGTDTFNACGTNVWAKPVEAPSIPWWQPPSSYASNVCYNVCALSEPTSRNTLAGPNTNLVLQNDGNLILWGNDGKQHWTSGSNGRGVPPYQLVMQSDSDLVIYDGQQTPIWSSRTVGPLGSYYFTNQTDGNCVVYGSNNQPIWSTGTVLYSTGPPAGAGLSGLISRDQYGNMTGVWDDGAYYGCPGFIKGGQLYPSFASNSNPTIAKREVAAFLAHVKQETQFYAVDENPDAIAQYGAGYSGGAKYHGRGPFQITHDFNYSACSQALFGDNRLVDNPDVILSDSSLGWATAFWCWTNSGQHDLMNKDPPDFGGTIRIQNGGFECGNGSNLQAQANRIASYQSFCGILGVDAAGNLTC